MHSYEVEVSGHEWICSDVISVRSTRPTPFTFRPGQYLVLELDTGGAVERKPFTISSGAHDPFLEITTRVSESPYKRTLTCATPGTRVRVVGPAGRLIVPGEVARVAFLVGGVGVTPVASMVRTWRSSGERMPEVVVFLGNHDAGCTPLAGQIAPVAGERLSLVHVLEETPPEWSGEHGFITAEIVRAHVDIDRGWLFVVAGPPPMVGPMERVLRELGVDPGDQLIERFGPIAGPASR